MSSSKNLSTPIIALANKSKVASKTQVRNDLNRIQIGRADRIITPQMRVKDDNLTIQDAKNVNAELPSWLFKSGDIVGLVLHNTSGEICYAWPNAEGDGLEHSKVMP